MKVLITGGAGFIGSYLCERLHAEGHQVVLLDCLSPQIHPCYEGSFLQRKVEGKATLLRGDVSDPGIWPAALEGVEAVVHLAAETGTGQSMYEVGRYYNVNVQGTAAMLDYIVNRKLKLAKLIVASSRAIYGEGKYLSQSLGVQYPGLRLEANMARGLFEPLSPDDGRPMTMLPTDEDSRLQPSSIYGLTKLAQEQMVMLMGRQLGLPAVALRFQNVYGPGQSLSNPYTGLLAVFFNRLRHGNPLEVYEDGQETRDFVFIEDVIESILLGLSRPEADGEVFNVGSGKATPILEVAELMRRQMESQVEARISGRYRVGDIRHNCADLSKIRRLLGFEPKVGVEEGLRRFVDWARQQEAVQDRYEESISELAARGLMK